MLIQEGAGIVRPRRRPEPPLIDVEDLLGVVYAYPLFWLIRLFPAFTLWTAKTCLLPVYRLLLFSARRTVAERISRWMAVPAERGEVLARLFMNHVMDRAVLKLSLLSGREPIAYPNSQIVGREHLDRALDNGRGVLLISIHSFALIPAMRMLRRNGYRMLSIRGLQPPRFGRLARPWLGPRTRHLSELMLSESEYVNRKDPDCSLRATQRLRDGGIVFLCPDVGGSRAVEVRFLQGTYRIGSGVLALARLSGAFVVPLTAAYVSGGLRIELGAPLSLSTHGTTEECSAANLPVLVAELERQVRAYPDQWEKWLR